MRKILSTLILVILAVGAGLLAFYFININLKSTNTETIKFEIESGQGAGDLSEALLSEGLIRDKLVFRTYLYTTGKYKKIQPGVYFLETELKLKELVNNITPDPDKKTEIEIKIIEGWSSMDIGAYLEEQGLIDQVDFMELVETTDSRDIIPDKSYWFLTDKPKDQGLEGYLFPDTYRVYADATGEEIIEKMLDNFEDKVEDIDYDTLILASVLEKELRTKEERRTGAGIFLNRLENGVALQSDATVNYVTGKSTTMPSLDDLQANSEYNTYMYKGLPPGPICSPSLLSIEAVLDPIESDYMYFLTKPDGTAVFSYTYDEHLENKAKYYE